MTNSNENVRAVRDALREILELSQELKEWGNLPADEWDYSLDGYTHSLTIQKALDAAYAYALHFLRSNLLTHGEGANAAAGVIGSYAHEVTQALRSAQQCLEETEAEDPWLECGQQFIEQIGPQLMGLRENLPLALLKSPSVEEFEEVAGNLSQLALYFEEAKERIDEILDGIDEHQQSAAALVTQIASKQDQAQAALDSINATLEEAQSLQESIENFKEEFASLSENHGALLSKLEDRKQELDQLMTVADQHKERTREILEAAREALGWAQASGLSGASHESWEQYRTALAIKGRWLACALVAIAAMSALYLFFAPGLVTSFLSKLEVVGVEPNAYITWFVKVLSFAPLLALGYGVWTMGVDYTVLRNLAHAYRHREVLARTLQAFRELGPEEDKAEITRNAFDLFLEDPMLRAYRGLSPIQRVTGELKTIVGKLKGAVDTEDSESLN